MEILGLVENMSGLKCPYCGKTIDVFKTRGGEATARRENLRLLATLPLEVEVVKEGDSGDISLLDNKTLLITQKFNKMVDEIVKLTDPKSPLFGGLNDERRSNLL
jgi:hypothetical protein